MDQLSEQPQRPPTHTRRVSAPLQQDQIMGRHSSAGNAHGRSGSMTTNNMSNNISSNTTNSGSSNSRTMNRRMQLERHWSANHVFGAVNNSNNGANSSNSSIYIGGGGMSSVGGGSSSNFGSYMSLGNFGSIESTNDDSSVLSNWQSWATGDLVFGAERPSNAARQFSNASVATSVPPPPSSVSPRVDSATGLSSTIHDAARITDWDKVLKLCKSDPDLARYAGRDGWTALHHACNRRIPRPDVAEALINAYPDALLKSVEDGKLPLHYACRFKAPCAVVSLLLNLHPAMGRASVTKRDGKGRTPLYYAVRYDAPPGVVGVLLNVDPSVVLEEDSNDSSPIALVWDDWAEKSEGRRTLSEYCNPLAMDVSFQFLQERSAMLHKQLQRDSKLNKRWKKVNMLLKAAFGFYADGDDEDYSGSESNTDSNAVVEPERQWRVVHAVASIKCHLSLFLLACVLHPEQIRELDDNDLRRPGDKPGRHQTALHLAVSSNAGGENAKTLIETLLRLHPDAAFMADGIDGSLPLHRLVENEYKQDWVLFGSTLYEVNPRAVQTTDSYGRLPLHRATAAIKQVDAVNETPDLLERSSVVQLLQAYPQAASRADQQGCLPLHIVAQHAEVWDYQLQMLYEAYPKAINVRAASMLDSLPLHIAAANTDSRESLLTKLATLHPRAASMVDKMGKLPMHLVCEMGKEWDAGVASIYEAYPNAIKTAEDNSRGWLPLHIIADAVNTNNNEQMIAHLIREYPQAAEVADKNGRYPLHLACRAGKCWNNGLHALFAASPGIIGVGDNNGMTPFLVAAVKYSNKSSAQRNEDNRRSSSGDLNELNSLFNLLRSDPTVLMMA